MKCCLAAMIVIACGSGAGSSPGLTVTSPPPDQRTFTQPRAVVWGEAPHAVAVDWENLTAQTRGPAHLIVQVVPCLVVIPCTPEEQRTEVGYNVAIPLVPGLNDVRIRARDAAGGEASVDIGLSFTPGVDAPSVQITGAQPEYLRADLRGRGNGLVSLEWRNGLTGETGTIEGDGWGPTDLTYWSAFVPIAPGTNPITVRGTGWTGVLVEDSVVVDYLP